MKKEILSLKSLYKFLTSNDYPVYSEGIIKKDNRTGLTLTKFCYEIILIDFKNRKNGKVIWRTEGGRNRYVSEICNRSNRLNIYREYAEEIAATADAKTVYRQIKQFVSFLVNRQYNQEVFFKKLPDYIALFAREDENFTEDAVKFFENTITEWAETKGETLENTFCCGWFLTFLMFHALAGNGEGEDVLKRLRRNSSLSLREMRKLFLNGEEISNTEVVFLTSTNTELNCPPLTPGHFFGREEEMFELREMLNNSGAYLISGMGGIGKTELMRQFVKCCEEEGLVDCICVVQYEGGLAKSMVRAFPQIYGTDMSENFKKAISRIRVHAGKKILIVIDNMDGGIEEEELEVLGKLPATIFITSRYQKLKGFKTYRLKPIGKDSGRLIFRDNYGSRLSEDDKRILDEIVNKDLWCHTLTLRLLARTAKNNFWTLAKLQEILEKGNTLAGYTEQERYEGLKQVYRDMYQTSVLSKETNQLLRLWATFPYRHYDVSFADRYLQGILGKENSMEECLENLWTGGWLEKSDHGYAMHPFISECLLSSPITEEECAVFLNNLEDIWERSGKLVNQEYVYELSYNWDKEYNELNKELLQATMLVRSVGSRLSGKFSERFIQLFLLSVMIESNYYGASKIGLELLKKIRGKAEKVSIDTKICIYILLCNYGWDDLQVLEDEYQKLSQNEYIAARMKHTFADALSIRYYNLGISDKSDYYVNEILEKCTDNGIRLNAFLLKANLAAQKGDFAGYGEWLQKGIEVGRRCGREKSREMQQLLCGMCALNLAYRKFTEAEQNIKELQSMTEVENYYLIYQITFYRGSLAMHRGDAGYGVDDLKEAVKWAEPLFKGIEDANLATIIVELAMAQNKAGSYEEAAESYQKALALYEALSGHEFERHRILNNMSVMYLDQKLYEKALKCLKEAYEMAKAMGGLPLAETGNNYSKAWRGMGDREKELQYLAEAAPVLEQFYGSEHPKVVDAKARLTEGTEELEVTL